jgi:hypothetical protein
MSVKATLEFDLPDDELSHLESLHGSKAFSALSEIKQLIRNWRKYDESYTPESLLSKIEQELIEVGISTGVDI